MDNEAIPDNFLFAIITSNPLKDNVRVIVDDGTIRLIMKRDKFAGLIQDLCGRDMRIKTEIAMREFGETYVIDRTNADIVHVKPDKLDTFNITNIGKDSRAQIAHTDAGRIQYNEALKAEYEELLSVAKPGPPKTYGFVDYRKQK